jgi:hypothetical protein
MVVDKELKSCIIESVMEYIYSKRIFRLLINLDIIFLLFSIIFIVYTFFQEIISFNYSILYIILIYDIFNLIKIIVIIIYIISLSKKRIIISKYIKTWLVFSIILFVISTLLFVLTFIAFSNGA